MLIFSSAFKNNYTSSQKCGLFAICGFIYEKLFINRYHIHQKGLLMIDILLGVVVVIICSIIGIISGYTVMNFYYRKRFMTAAEKCRDDDSFEPFINEMEDIS